MKKTILLALVSVIILSGCSANSANYQSDAESSSSEDFANPTTTLVTDPENKQGDVQTDPPEVYQMVMTDFAYSIEEITAKPGDTITIDLINEEGYHDLVIDELDYHSPHLEEGTSEQISIPIPEDMAPGTYEFYCSVGNHQDQGMVGQLIIE